MSIKILKPIETESGLTLENGYARLTYKLEKCGTKVQVWAEYYASEAAYRDGKQPIKTDLPTEQLFNYDRLNDGFDVLQFAHDSFKNHLIETYKTQPVLADKLDDEGNVMLNEKNVPIVETIGTTYFFETIDLLIEL